MKLRGSTGIVGILWKVLKRLESAIRATSLTSSAEGFKPLQAFLYTTIDDNKAASTSAGVV